MRIKTLTGFFCVLIFGQVFPVFAGGDDLLPMQIQNKINKDFNGARLAEKADFGPYFKTVEKRSNVNIDALFNTLIAFDLTRDSDKDYVLLIINIDDKYFKFVSYISDDNYSSPHVLSTTSWPMKPDWWPKEQYGTIWEVMWLKKPGEPGLSDETYFNAPGAKYPWFGDYTEEDIRTYKAAVKRYVSMPVIEKSDAIDLEDDGLFYCKSAFYFEDGQFKSVRKCD